jgi:hypothetical protein
MVFEIGKNDLAVKAAKYTSEVVTPGHGASKHLLEYIQHTKTKNKLDECMNDNEELRKRIVELETQRGGEKRKRRYTKKRSTKRRKSNRKKSNRRKISTKRRRY